MSFLQDARDYMEKCENEVYPKLHKYEKDYIDSIDKELATFLSKLVDYHNLIEHINQVFSKCEIEYKNERKNKEHEKREKYKKLEDKYKIF